MIASLTLQSLLFLEKARVFPQKSKGFSLRGTPKILGKERKNAQKSKENRKKEEKSKEIEEKKQGLEGQGWEKWNLRSLAPLFTEVTVYKESQESLRFRCAKRGNFRGESVQG